MSLIPKECNEDVAVVSLVVGFACGMISSAASWMLTGVESFAVAGFFLGGGIGFMATFLSLIIYFLRKKSNNV